MPVMANRDSRFAADRNSGADTRAPPVALDRVSKSVLEAPEPRLKMHPKDGQEPLVIASQPCGPETHRLQFG